MCYILPGWYSRETIPEKAYNLPVLMAVYLIAIRRVVV